MARMETYLEVMGSKNIFGRIEQRCESVRLELCGIALCKFMLETKAVCGA